jgi:MEMO1 family protein
MGKIINAYVVPHPPLIIPEIGKGSESRTSLTINGVKRVASEIKKDRPSVIILTSPHAPLFQDFIHIAGTQYLSGSFSQFGAGNVKLQYENSLDLVNRIVLKSRAEGIPAGTLDDKLLKKNKISSELDHGTLVPLYYISREVENFNLICISIAGLPLRDLYKFGICINQAVSETEEQVVFVASGDLSHKLSGDAPYGYSPRGREFDKLVVDSFKNMDIDRLLDIDEDLSESAGECGLRSFIIMLGAIDGYKVKSEVYSYEGPFGVGYAAAGFIVG